MANKTLTATVRVETKSAEKALSNLTKKINNVQNAINKTSKNNSKLTTAINKAVTAQNKLNTAANKTANTTRKIATENQKAVNSANKLSGAYNSANRSASNLATTVKRLAATYLGFMGTKAIISTSDTITHTQNKLNNLNGGDENLTQEQMDKMYASSNKVRMDYTDMLANASKSMTLAGSAFQGDMDNAIRFQEIMAETYALGGASAPEMSTSMYQMIQALGSGTLAGDELRSVREGAPLAYKEIEKFAQGIYDTTDSLKDMAAEGMITSDIVVAAIMNAGKDIDAQFEKTTMTFDQAWSRIKNAAVKAFEPISNQLSEMLDRVAKSGAFEKIEQAFWNISKVIQIIFKIIENTISWIVDNWDWLKNVIVGALLLIIGYLIMEAGVAVYCAYQKMKAWMLANLELLKTLAIIAIVVMAVLALVYIFYLWKTGAIDTCQAIVSALIIVGIAVALIGLLMLNWTIAIIGLAIAAVGLIIKYLDYFLAAVYSIGAAIWNIIVGVVNAIIQFLWSHFVEPWIGIIEWIINAFKGGFDGLGGAVANLVGNMISWFLSLGQVVTKIVDAILGTNWSDGLEELKSKVTSWGKKENAITLNREAPTVLNRINYTDAWNTGMEHGSAAKDWLSGLGSKFQTGFDGFSLDNIGEKLGLDFGDGFPSGDEYDVSNAYNIEDILSGIGADVGDMKDSMELSNNELDYLRRLADMEWRNEFTTAEIKVDMTNNNTVNGERDLDGIVEYLSDVLRSEMTNVAYGVHY